MKNRIYAVEKDIAHVAMHGDTLPHDILPGTEGDSDNQKVPPSNNSTFIKENTKKESNICKTIFADVNFFVE